MPGGTFSWRNKKVSFTAWNIRGVSDKVIGDKLQNDCFISNIKNNDIIVLTETWTRTDVQVSGFKSFVSKPNNRRVSYSRSDWVELFTFAPVRG